MSDVHAWARHTTLHTARFWYCLYTHKLHGHARLNNVNNWCQDHTQASREAYREADNACDLLITNGFQLLQALSTGEVPDLQTQQETVSNTTGECGGRKALTPYVIMTAHMSYMAAHLRKSARTSASF